MHLQVNGTGKSYLSKHLVEIGLAQEYTGFAIPIKRLTYALYCSNGSFNNKDLLSYEEFAQGKKNEPIFYGGLSPRDLVCAYSDLIQQFYGPNIWGKTTYSSITIGSTVVIDDWRRYIESDYLKNQEDVNVTTLYLDIEKTSDTVDNIPSKGSAHYEGEIKPEDCDLYFKYKSDYSNFNELIQLITNHLNTLK